MSDAPERIWMEERVGSNGISCLDYKNDDDSPEYILKETADKDMEKILQPIRDAMKGQSENVYAVLCNNPPIDTRDLFNACQESLALADKK
jgi:hypothetical protein